MSAAAMIDDVRCHVRALEAREARKGGSVGDARRRLATKLGCAPGTLETIHKGRLKRLDAWLRDSIQRLLVSEIEREIGALTHELEILRQHGGETRSVEIAEVEDLLAKARALMA